MRALVATAAVAAISVGAVAPAQAASHAPNVRCWQLDRAESKLRAKGFRVVERGGGFFGIVVKSAWVVANQRQQGRTVILTAARSC
jgi:hypothetical protein